MPFLFSFPYHAIFSVFGLFQFELWMDDWFQILVQVHSGFCFRFLNRKELVVIYVACAFPVFILLSYCFHVLLDLPFGLCISYFCAPIVLFLCI